MPNQGDVVSISNCPCCGSSSSSSSGCGGCPPPNSTTVKFTIVSGTLFPGGVSTAVLVYDAANDRWSLTYPTFGGVVVLLLVCRRSNCAAAIGVTITGNADAAAVMFPYNGMVVVLTGAAGAFNIRITW